MNELSNSELTDLCEAARKAAVEAGEYIQSQFDEQYTKQHKEGGDSLASQVVTEVDFKAQEIILKTLQPAMERYDLGLLTEELEDDNSRAEKAYFWCIDPMDGTLPFTEHQSGYAVSIALISQSGDPLIGVVYVPDLQSCYTSVKGEGVHLNGRPFLREATLEGTIHFYMDRSFQSEPYYKSVKQQFEKKFTNQGVQFHADFGGVRNAIGVLSSGSGCYFKFPKERKGCGSTWDYAATRLFMEELGLWVTNAKGERLELNDPSTTFMNRGGILYATDEVLAVFIMGMPL